MKEIITNILAKEVKATKENINNLVEKPQNEALGDYAFPCFSLAKEQKKSPIEIASDLSDKLKKHETKEIASIEQNGPYVNFFLNKHLLAQEVINLTKKKDWGKINGKIKTALIEFSQPNTHKAFHVGHIRGTSVGESLSRIFETAGSKVIRANYSGDTGMHIAKWMWCYEKYHNKEELKNDESWIAHIYVDAVKRLSENKDLQKEVDVINKKIETKEDKKINELWEKTRKLSIESWKKIYDELQTRFDRHYFESEVEGPGKEIAKKLVTRNIARVDQGATIMDLKAYDLSVWVLLRSDDTVLYSAKDIALAKLKFEEYPADFYLTTFGDEQALHFKQIQKTLELMKEKDAKKYHTLPFGMVRLPDGKMSSRTGQNILYSDFIIEVKSIAEKRIRERAKDITKKELDKRSLILSIAAIKYAMLKQDPKRAIIFNPESDVAFEGDTGPYLLYSYARASSILRKSNKDKEVNIIDLNPSEVSLIKKIYEFPEIITKAYNTLAPNVIASYSYLLAKTFSEFYHNSQVIGGIEEGFRLELVRSFKTTLQKALNLLGIEVLEEM